jgi:hypothetical protein
MAMSQFLDTEFQPSVTVAALIDNEPLSRGNRNRSSVRRIHRSARDKYIARTTVLMIAAIGILLVPFISLLSKRADLLQDLPIFYSAPSDPDKTPSAVLAVDTTGFTIRAQNVSADRRELFEQVAVRHLAKLHRTYSSWADRNHELMGSLLIKLTVDPTGTVIRVEPLASLVTNPNFIQSVVADVRSWKFPRGSGETIEMTVPLLFVPKGMDPETVVQWERKVRSAQEAEISLARSPVPDKVPVPSVSETIRKPLPPLASSDHKPSKSSTVQREAEISLARSPVLNKVPVASSSETVRKSLPPLASSDHKPSKSSTVQQEAEVSLARSPVPDKVPVPSVSETIRKPSQLLASSDTKRSKSSTIQLPKQKTPEEAVIAFKTNRPVAIRENPSFSAKKIHEAGEDTQLAILENRGDWLKVNTAGAGFVGFVRKEFVSPRN